MTNINTLNPIVFSSSIALDRTDTNRSYIKSNVSWGSTQVFSINASDYLKYALLRISIRPVPDHIYMPLGWAYEMIDDIKIHYANKNISSITKYDKEALLAELCQTCETDSKVNELLKLGGQPVTSLTSTVTHGIIKVPIFNKSFNCVANSSSALNMRSVQQIKFEVRLKPISYVCSGFGLTNMSANPFFDGPSGLMLYVESVKTPITDSVQMIMGKFFSELPIQSDTSDTEGRIQFTTNSLVGQNINGLCIFLKRYSDLYANQSNNYYTNKNNYATIKEIKVYGNSNTQAEFLSPEFSKMINLTESMSSKTMEMQVLAEVDDYGSPIKQITSPFITNRQDVTMVYVNFNDIDTGLNSSVFQKNQTTYKTNTINFEVICSLPNTKIQPYVIMYSDISFTAKNGDVKFSIE